MTNEIITLAQNEGLEVDFAKIEYTAPSDGSTPSRPTWVIANLSFSEIVSKVATLSTTSEVVRFTEDHLEIYLKQWLEYHFNCEVSSFRWIWDTYRICKVA